MLKSHLSDGDSPEEGEIARQELSPGQSRHPVRLELHLQPLGGEEPHPFHSLQEPPELLPHLLRGDLQTEGGDGLDTEPPVVHALGDGQKSAGSDLVVVELLGGSLGVLSAAVSDVAIGPGTQSVEDSDQ